ncbi:Uncharacterized protein TCAP_03056 [Tolypocladium capitatum]|uniref:Uncharacterized protein n=1 Tax=Tolypocladium capitatum TaxID=45235 RepID=A0A2K3QHJ4_9HYPO|nr:Uncharacterized protein TCAP_03056 [Tolypocladium capitatum]
MSPSTTPNVTEGPKEPIRILVQTKTLLVPGHGYHKRCCFMLDVICQHVWNRNFDSRQDRWTQDGALFAYDHRRCYFLVDNGESPADSDVPVLWYDWTGETLRAMPQVLPPKIQTRLKEYPFNKKDNPPRPPPDANIRRRSIRWKLRSEMELNDGDVGFLREDPEEVRRLEERIEARFWPKFEALVNSPNDQE